MADSLTGYDDLVAVVLAAGAGTRLRPLSALLPKPLCPVGGVALVDLALDRAHSVTPHVAVNVHHGAAHHGAANGWAPSIEAHLAGAVAAGSPHLSVEGPEALGTAGALGHLRDWIDGRPVLVVNADSWHRADMGDFATGWDGRRTRLLTVVDARRGTWGDRRYAGAALLPWAEVACLPDRPSGLWESSWHRLVPGRDLDLVDHGGAFFDCGTPAGYLAANLEASDGRSVVHATAFVEGTVESTVVWPGARVARGEHLFRAVRATGGVTVLVR
ncbi:MAG: nucleotidyltransferase family protein [Acidimicrobiales bacterium]